MEDHLREAGEEYERGNKRIKLEKTKNKSRDCISKCRKCSWKCRRRSKRKVSNNKLETIVEEYEYEIKKDNDMKIV